MNNDNTADKSTFISYRSSDGINLPENLYTYLHDQGIDVFLDREKHVNNEPIQNCVIIAAGKRSNFVLLLSVQSINELINYCIRRKSNCDCVSEQVIYVYEELNAAIQNRNNIIPVFFEDHVDEDTVKQLAGKLFIDCLGLEDSYSYIHRKSGESDADLFREIWKRLYDKQAVSHVNLSEVYWVGTRESDMPHLESAYGFKGAILLFGKVSSEKYLVMCDETSEQRVDHNDAADIEQDIFIEKSVGKIIKNDPDAKFMFYNPSAVYKLRLDEKYGANHFICMNSKDVLDRVNNKRSFRELVANIVPLLPVLERVRTDCGYDDLLEAKNKGEFADDNDYQVSVPEIQYDDDLQFIIQAPISSGGSGTFILNRKNAQFLLSLLDKRAKYLVSIYHTKNVPVNMHVLIYENRIVYCPASIQIIREVTAENKLLYKGADFIAYRQIASDLREQFEAQVKKVAEKLKQIGYRGVCGIDAIIHDGRVNILEVNGRFQASTELINCALLRRGFKTIQERNYEAFFGPDPDDITPFNLDFKVPYSNYVFSYEGQTRHDMWIYNQAFQSDFAEQLQADGYVPDPQKRYDAQAYLYRIAFNKNIASVNEDGEVLVHENICEPDKWLVRKILSKEKLAVKIALMIQGIHVEDSIRNTLREATNNAVDLQFGKGENIMIINAPTNIRFVEFSPFTLVPSHTYNNKYSVLYYGDLLLDNVGVFPADKNQALVLKDQKHSYSEIAYLSTDRLRVHLTNACCFKLQNSPNNSFGNGCKFCNIEVDHNPNPITSSDIREVVEKYIEDKREAAKKHSSVPDIVPLKHFLIGGQSLQNGDKALIDTAKELSKYKMPIYVMTLPLKEETVRELVSYGVLEFAYNIEIFNDRCRKKYMPGKGLTTVGHYLSALKKTRQILNTANYSSDRKAVRSMVIVGLEPYRDMMAGIQTLIDNNIEPMLSVFRPLPNTPLENMNAPAMRMVYDLFGIVSSMLYQKSSHNSVHFRKLGPRCSCCQNNTVSLPWNIQKSKDIQAVWCIDPSKDRFEE